MIIEKTLLSIGQDTCEYVRKKLEDNHASFRDCYEKPEVLRQALKESFGNRYIEISKKILENIHDITLNRKLVTFVKVINN
jgi:hypothetical protein